MAGPVLPLKGHAHGLGPGAVMGPDLPGAGFKLADCDGPTPTPVTLPGEHAAPAVDVRTKPEARRTAHASAAVPGSHYARH